jgi:catechol 2,3-dioxygenase-like lactoylglutathione lyase family enzyme
MKITGHRHTGIIVNHFDVMLDFYVGLGLVLRRRDNERARHYKDLLSLSNENFPF